jgi:hypothetical protein
MSESADQFADTSTDEPSHQPVISESAHATASMPTDELSHQPDISESTDATASAPTDTVPTSEESESSSSEDITNIKRPSSEVCARMCAFLDCAPSPHVCLWLLLISCASTTCRRFPPMMRVRKSANPHMVDLRIKMRLRIKALSAHSSTALSAVNTAMHVHLCTSESRRANFICHTADVLWVISVPFRIQSRSNGYVAIFSVRYVWSIVRCFRLQKHRSDS